MSSIEMINSKFLVMEKKNYSNGPDENTLGLTGVKKDSNG